MGLTEIQKRLVQSIAQRDFKALNKLAIECLKEDTTQKNKHFCDRYISVLESKQNNLIELPQNLKGILCVEDVSTSFCENRYYLSNREQKVFENIMRMKKVNEKLMEMHIPYLNSTLLYGESGTGKTTFGRYIAYKTGLPFCYLNFSNLVDSYMGNTSKNIDKAFNYAISNPCVFMLDEIDCISIRRTGAGSSSGSDGEMARITISLMQEFDRLPNDIIVIGATNRKDRIDDALLRRFSYKHEVEPLNPDEKIKMLRKFISDINVEFTNEETINISNTNGNQSAVLNELVRQIALKVENELR